MVDKPMDMVNKPVDLVNHTTLVDHLGCLMVDWTQIFIARIMSFRPNCFAGRMTQNLGHRIMSFTWSLRLLDQTASPVD